MSTQEADAAAAKPPVRPGRIIGAIVTLLIVVQLGWFLVTNERFEWGVVLEYLFAPSVLVGLGVTILLTVVCMVLGTLLAIPIAAGQLSDFWLTRWVCKAYVGFFRGVPPLVQLILWFNLAYLLPRIELGVPFTEPWFSVSTNTVMTPVVAAIVGLSLHEAAYMAEIIRAGLMSVGQGQRDAARAVGFNERQEFWKVVLPQSLLVIIPPTGSQVIGLLKGTSLVSVIGMTDLLLSVQIIYNITYQVMPLLFVAVFWYLVCVGVLTLLQGRVEKGLSRSVQRTAVGRRGRPRLKENDVTFA